MKHGKIIRGEPFDWGEAVRAQRALADAADEDGHLELDNATFGTAMAADPGVCKCPLCSEFLWCEGEVIECPECQTWVAVQSGKLAISPRKHLLSFDLDPELADRPRKARSVLGRLAREVLREGYPCGGNEVQMSGMAFKLALLVMIVAGATDEIIEVES